MGNSGSSFSSEEFDSLRLSSPDLLTLHGIFRLIDKNGKRHVSSTDIISHFGILSPKLSLKFFNLFGSGRQIDIQAFIYLTWNICTMPHDELGITFLDLIYHIVTSFILQLHFFSNFMMMITGKSISL